MKYEYAEDIQKIAEEISTMLFPHIDMKNVKCFRSLGTNSRGTIARCHGLPKVMQKAMGINAIYVLEFLTERFEKFNKEEQIKIIIHELMHIPKSFGGGFKHHDFVTEKNVNICYVEYKKRVLLKKEPIVVEKGKIEEENGFLFGKKETTMIGKGEGNEKNNKRWF